MKKKLRIYIHDDKYVAVLKLYAKAYVNEAVEQAALMVADHGDSLNSARHKEEYRKLANRIRDIKKWEYQS